LSGGNANNKGYLSFFTIKSVNAHYSSFSDIQYDALNNLIITSSNDGFVKIWTFPDFTLRKTILVDKTDNIPYIKLHPESCLFVIFSNTSLLFYTLPTVEKFFELSAYSTIVKFSFSFSGMNAAFYDLAYNMYFLTIDIENLSIVQNGFIQIYLDIAIKIFEFTKGNNFVIIIFENDEIFIYDIVTSLYIKLEDFPYSLSQIIFFNNIPTHFLFHCIKNGSIGFAKLEESSVEIINNFHNSFDNIGNIKMIAVVFNSSQTKIISVSNDTLFIWNINSQIDFNAIKNSVYTNQITILRPHPKEDNTIYTVGMSKELIIWDILNLLPLITIQHLIELSFPIVSDWILDKHAIIIGDSNGKLIAIELSNDYQQIASPDTVNNDLTPEIISLFQDPEINTGIDYEEEYDYEEEEDLEQSADTCDQTNEILFPDAEEFLNYTSSNFNTNVTIRKNEPKNLQTDHITNEVNIESNEEIDEGLNEACTEQINMTKNSNRSKSTKLKHIKAPVSSAKLIFPNSRLNQNSIDFLSSPPHNFQTLFKYLPSSFCKELEFLKQFGFLQQEVKCNNCHSNMVAYFQTQSRNQLCLRCPKCKFSNSFLQNTIFENFHCPLKQILIVFYCFSVNESLRRTSIESELCINTVQKIFRILRLCCSKLILKQEPFKIGGEGDAVQIDETHISKRKQNVGRSLWHFWIIGGISENTNEIFLTSSQLRTEAVMKKIIETNIKEQTIIKTDGWRSYRWIAKSKIYKHQMVNHKENFVNPKDGTNTQKIERLWLEIKELKRRRRGLKIDTIETYLHEFLWRRNFLVKANNQFFATIYLVQQYAT
jgi:hypothetical protein